MPGFLPIEVGLSIGLYNEIVIEIFPNSIFTL